MRVAWQTHFRIAETGIQRLQQQVAQAQQQLATGSRLNSLGDDPVAFQRAARLQELLDTTERRRLLLQSLNDELQAAQTQTEALSNVLQDIQTLAVGALDPKNLDKPAFLAQQLRQRIQDVVALANARGSAGYLFGGTLTLGADGAPPFVLRQEAPTGENPSGLVVEFRGNLAVRQAEVFPGQAEEWIPSAEELFGAQGTELFVTLIAVYNLLAYRADGSPRPAEEALSATERAQLEALLPQLVAFRQRLDRATARMGARQERWTALQEQLQEYATQLRAFRSAAQDTDIVQVALQLQQAQTALQALLQATSRTLGMSLFDFLR